MLIATKHIFINVKIQIYTIRSNWILQNLQKIISQFLNVNFSLKLHIKQVRLTFSHFSKSRWIHLRYYGAIKIYQKPVTFSGSCIGGDPLKIIIIINQLLKSKPSFTFSPPFFPFNWVHLRCRISVMFEEQKNKKKKMKKVKRTPRAPKVECAKIQKQIICLFSAKREFQ